jgi:hypothetical protein
MKFKVQKSDPKFKEIVSKLQEKAKVFLKKEGLKSNEIDK